MKIAQVTLRFDAPGGVETNVREVSRRLVAAGEEVTVYASDLYDEGRWERRTGYADRVDGVPVRRFVVHKRLIPGLTMPLMVGLIDALAASGSDILHAHSHRYGHVLETAAVAHRRDVPLVVSTHYHPADAGEPAWKRGMLRLQDVGFGASAYRIAAALVVETERERRLVAEFAPAARIRVIPPGIDLAAATARGVPPPDLPASYFLFLGRIAPNKGLPFLLDAYAGLPPAGRPDLVLMGRDWGMRETLAARARASGVDGQVHFPGHVADETAVYAAVRGARALVLPSEWEAFGLVLLAAMATETPIVATSVGGVPEVLEQGRCGRLVPYGDVPALANALRAVADDRSTTADLLRAAARRVTSLDWSVAANAHRALYRELVRG